MAYKAVFVNESHIAHAGHKEDWQGKWHGSDGTYQVKPEWAKAGYGRRPEGTENYFSGGGHHDSNAVGGGRLTTWKNHDPDFGDTTPPSASEPEAPKNTDYYRYQNPKNMTDEQLAEANLRAVRESNYNKNYPSRSEEFMKGAQQANQLVNQGAAFTKSLMPDKIYAAPLDLSNMTDEQLRAANNRAQLESQYNQYFNPPKQNEAKKWVDVAATGIGLAISAAGVAVPIVIEVMRNKKGG